LLLEENRRQHQSAAVFPDGESSYRRPAVTAEAEDGGDIFLRIVGRLSTDYTAYILEDNSSFLTISPVLCNRQLGICGILLLLIRNGCLSKESVQVRGSVEIVVTN
jgi:hypothetical protein